MIEKDTIFKVLNDGHIRIVDWMGDDSSIVQAARVSYGKGTKTVSEDKDLIRYLMRHYHTTPFEMCVLKLHVRVPMDCWRQWIRHRMSSVNEYSTRYSEAIDSRQVAHNWRIQSKTNKQGSEEGSISWPEDTNYYNDYKDDYSPEEYLSIKETELHENCQNTYQERLDFGVAKEQARKDLPLSTYTEAYWKIDLHNLFHFLRLRMDSHAQEEIRTYATIIGEQIVSKWVPIAWEAFQDYRLNAMNLSATEIMCILNLLTTPNINFHEHLGKREQGEFKNKCKKLGIILF
jgi:thymidylate synthase (FAD)